MRNTILSFVISFFIITLAFAEHDGIKEHGHATKPKVDAVVNAVDVVVQPHEAVIIVHGIVCSFCSQGVTRNLSKLDFIDKSKYTKGVKVEIENQKVTIAIKSDSKLDLAQVYKSITKGGYEPVAAYVSDDQGNIIIHKADDIK